MTDIWGWLLTYPQVLAALITFALGILLQVGLRIFASRPKLRWGQMSDTVFLVPLTANTDEVLTPTGAVAPPAEGEVDIAPAASTPQIAATGVFALPPHHSYRSRTIWLVNSGSAIAEDVEVAFNWPPQHIEWYPHIPTKITRQPDGRYILTISTLNPKEGVNFGLLSLNQDHPDLMHVRCKGYPGKQIALRSQQVYPWWINATALGLMALGVFTIVSWIVTWLLIRAAI